MPQSFSIHRTALAAALFGITLSMALPSTPAVAASEVRKAEEENAEKAKAQRKKDKEFNRDILYRHTIGPDVLPLGPYTISLYVRGQLTEGRVRVAVQAKDTASKSLLEGEKFAMNGIIYPLAVRMFENGRPTTEDLLNFKADARTQLVQRYKDLVIDVFLESLI